MSNAKSAILSVPRVMDSGDGNAPLPSGPAAPSPEEISWEALERQDWHLWILAILLMFVLGVSLLSFMFPSAFWFRDELAVSAPQRAFLGFCILLSLALVYMLQRQAMVRRLKRQLFQARAATTAAERKAVLQAFVTLPGMAQFRDMLAMEYRRAATSGCTLALAMFSIRNPSREELGHVANMFRYMLRRGESLFRVAENALALLLPRMSLRDAAAFASQAQEHMAAHFPEVDASVTVTAYPEDAAGLSELEGRLVGRIL